MYLWHIFLVKPLAALAIVACLATIFACFRLERRRPHQKADKFLIGFLGLLAVYQGFRILESVGLLPVARNSSLDDAIELLITLFYMIAAWMLRFSTTNHLDNESAFRLARAAPPRLSVETTTRELPVARNAVALDAIAWAVPRLSDGAFKLYAYLCVTSDQAGRAVVQEREIQLRMKRSPSELDGYWSELEQSGAATVRREAGYVEIEVGSHRIVDGAPHYSGAVTGIAR